MIGRKLTTIFLLFLFLFTYQQVPLPLPKKYHGHSFGNKLANVQIEIFLNIPCKKQKSEIKF